MGGEGMGRGGKSEGGERGAERMKMMKSRKEEER